MRDAQCIARNVATGAVTLSLAATSAVAGEPRAHDFVARIYAEHIAPRALFAEVSGVAILFLGAVACDEKMRRRKFT